MHEISLGYSIQDYLSGKEIQATTYEDLRQAIAKMLVERKGYPKQRLSPKVEICFQIQGQSYQREVDLTVYDQQGRPLLILIFCAGEVETYIRECLAAARLHPHGPARLAVVTDTNQALILRVADGELLRQTDYQAIPSWEELQKEAASAGEYVLDEKKRRVEERIFYAFSELSCSCRQCPVKE
ncbi:MAG: type I restriction enzyme HsdR N-terminal domain-containing protein [Thermodesulfobacteriota bacterium]